MSDQEKPQVLSAEDRTAIIHFPDEQACVKILEILVPFDKAARQMILEVVASNLAAGYPRVRVCGCDEKTRGGLRRIVMAAPLPSHAAHSWREDWREAADPIKPDAPFDIESFLRASGVGYRDPVAFEGGRKFVLEMCPFDASHAYPDAAVFQGADGLLGFRCLHNACQARTWRDFRAQVAN